MTSYLALDTETTTINKGDPYHPDNKLVSIGLYDGNSYVHYYKDFPIEEIQQKLTGKPLVLFNAKFDITWLRRIGIDISNFVIRDAQLAEFILTNQQQAYPSLDNCSIKYFNETKIDNIKLNYWDKGIDTWFIPFPELDEYLKQDCVLTYKLYQVQEQLLKEQNKFNLFKLQCADLKELQDYEYNGIYYNKEESIKRGNDLDSEIEKLTRLIKSYTNCPSFNCNSGDHLSCLLYGGTISHTDRVAVGVYKSGQKIGQPRYKLFETEYKQERLVEPLPKSELKKEGYWSTDEDTLKSLRVSGPVKKLVEAILELSKLEKLKGTYFLGIPALMDKKGWKNNLIHGQFNQVVARTGRTSSKEPNLQNFDPAVKQLCESRYE